VENFSVWTNAAVFLVAAATIWWAGTRLERDADRIARRTGLGHAFTGMLLLAAVTSLPELATTFTAVAILGNPTLAVHNLLGGVALQTAILVVADAVKPRRGSLTFFSPRYILLIEGLGVVLLLQIAIGGITARGVPTIGSVSTWVIALAAAYLLLMYIVYRDRGHSRWTPSRMDDVPAEVRREDATADEADPGSGPTPWVSFVTMSLLVLAGGWLATQTVDTLAEQTGLGSAFLGATALAAATSFPELSTTIAAVRNDRYVVAISNVFGSNAFDITLLVLAELLYTSGTIFAQVESTVVFAAAVGAVMTCLYLWGLMERQNRTVLRVGWDSAAAVLVYVVGVAVLYLIQ
jgi:cation:H+ antiporter